MKPCRSHKGTLIPYCWIQQKDAELVNIIRTMTTSERMPKFCTKCRHYVYEEKELKSSKQI